MTTNQPLFHDIVEAHGPTVLAVCTSMLGPGPEADDAWQETFVAALRAVGQEELRNPEAWLVRVARHKAVDQLRARKREHPTADTELVAALTNRTDDATASAPADQWMSDADDVWDDVAALTERQRFVILHHVVAGWTYVEVADQLGCSPAAARRCGSDAVKALRRLRAT